MLHWVMIIFYSGDSLVYGFRHVLPIAVRFRDLDAFGHVNNAVILTYIEAARLQYLRPLL